MGISDKNDDEQILQCSLQLDAGKSFLSTPKDCTEKSISDWKRFLFSFGSTMCSIFQIYINTKLHSLMCHVRDHLLNLGCLRRGWSGESEMRHKLFKSVYACAKKHISNIAPKSLRSTMHSYQTPTFRDDNESDLSSE